MREFKRGLDEDAADAVKKFLSTEVGKKILDDEHMVICIRNNYINVYLNGCSLLKYSPNKNEFLIHHKYLVMDAPTGSKDPYISLVCTESGDLKTACGQKSFLDDVLNNNNRCKELVEYLQNSKTLKSREKGQGEKALLARYMAEAAPKPFVLDLEVAFTRKRTDDEKNEKDWKKDTVADRIDMAVLEENGDRVKLKLVEVKIDYDSRLRSNEPGKQEVLLQMGNYKDFIDSEHRNILRSYKVVAENYLKLGVTNQFPENRAESVLKKFIACADESLNAPESEAGRGDNFALDMNPYLLIIRTDDKNMNGKGGVCHLKRLQAQFEEKYPKVELWTSQ